MNTPDPRTSEFQDHRRPLARALKAGGWALVAMTVVSLAVWGSIRDLPGIWGVLIGAVIGGGFVLSTAVSVLLTSDSSPSTTMAVVLGSWLVKLIVLIFLLMWLQSLDFYDTAAFGVTVILALIVVLATEVWGVVTTNVTYVG